MEAVGEQYNLKWNNHLVNFVNTIIEHQTSEDLVDVTLSCEGQCIKAHKLILSSCSDYFHKLFRALDSSLNTVIVLNNVQFKVLKHVVKFIYHGEVKVLEKDLPDVLALGETLQIKGLSSVKLKGVSPEPPPLKKKPQNTVQLPGNSSVMKSTVHDFSKPKTTTIPTKEDKPVEQTNSKQATNGDSNKLVSKAPNNAFILFGNEWRNKLMVEHPDESNKQISLRLGDMWKNLLPDLKKAYYCRTKLLEDKYTTKFSNENTTELKRKADVLVESNSQTSQMSSISYGIPLSDSD